MAKDKKETPSVPAVPATTVPVATPVAPVAVAIMVNPVSVTVRKTTVTLDTFANSPAGLAIELAYGVKQHLTDSFAGIITGINGTSKKAANNWSQEDIAKAAKDSAYTGDVATVEGRKVFAEWLADYAVVERLADIIAGTVGTRDVGPRLSPLEKEIRRLVDIEIKAAADKAGKPMPTGDKLKGNRDIVMAKIGAVITAKAEANLAAETLLGTDVTLDFGDDAKAA